MLGIIGGSGLYNLPQIENADRRHIGTPFGTPSADIVIGTVAGVEVAFLSRHGAGHRLSPTEVPYAANVFALKSVGVDTLISISAVGSLREGITPRSFHVPHQTIDRTVARRRTYFDDGVVAHVSMADPFCPALSQWVESAAGVGDLDVQSGGTYVCIEGPQFSTRAESELFRSWGASVIGMTALPEARLAREAELCYACLAMITDYDVWHADEGPVNVTGVLENLFAMTDAVQRIVVEMAKRYPHQCYSACSSALEAAIVTSPDVVSDAVRTRLSQIATRHW